MFDVLTYSEMKAFLSGKGYGSVPDMDGSEVDELALAEGYVWYDNMDAYRYENL